MAALANGALTHSFELDSLRSPGVGAHPGATIAAPALAVAQEQRASGRDLIVAFVAGCEVLFRIGLAAKHSSEKLGFHAPGLTGPYASAIASGRLMRLDAAQLTHALGIAGSLSSGVLAFSKSRSGGMVKRLHLGRAAESGVLAACFAQDGFTGPPEILEGRFGFLDVYARDAAPERLTADLGTRWETRFLTFKRYACHVYAHTPVQAMLELRAQHGFAGSDVASVAVEGNEKLVSHHAGSEPGDLASAQYSVAFCVALAAFRDADDPRSFSADAVADPQIRALTRTVTCTPLAGSDGGYGSRVTVVLRSGTTYAKQLAAFKGMPAEPLTGADVDAKFRRLATPRSARNAPIRSCLARSARTPRRHARRVVRAAMKGQAMNRRRFASLVGSAALPAFLPRPALADAPSVKFAISLRSVLYLPAVLAAQGGYFAKRGLNVDVSIVEGGSKTAAAVLSGDVDFANLGFQHVIALRAKSQPVVAVGTTLNDAAVVFMMSTKWLAAHNLDGKDPTAVIKALKGARIGTAGPGTTGDLILRTLLERNGMKQSDVATIAATSQAGIAALQNGSIDGTASYMPIIEMIEALGLEADHRQLADSRHRRSSRRRDHGAHRRGRPRARRDAQVHGRDRRRAQARRRRPKGDPRAHERRAARLHTRGAGEVGRRPHAADPATPILAYDRVRTAVKWFRDMGPITADIPFESLATNKYLT